MQNRRITNLCHSGTSTLAAIALAFVTATFLPCLIPSLALADGEPTGYWTFSRVEVDAPGPERAEELEQQLRRP